METLFTGRELLEFDELDSTNSYLKKICRETDLREGFTVVAKHQTSGRGQIGNKWEAEKGKNLLFSLLLRPVFLAPDRQFFLNMSVCLAVVDSLNEISPGFEIKWPNDFLYNGHKVGGILVENSILYDAIEHSIIGIGLNVNQTNFNGAGGRASVKIVTGFETDLRFLLNKILSKIEARYLKLKKGDSGGLYREYYSRLYGMERELPVEIGDRKTQITIKGVEPTGELIATENSDKLRFRFKEVRFILPQ